MTRERWARIREVFGAALQTPESERPTVLELECGGDVDLRAEVEQLLAGAAEPSWESPAAALLTLHPEVAPGDAVAQYRIDGKLGEGGMGVVYKAYDTRLHRYAALKLLFAEDGAGEKQRLMREARAASALNHPNIVVIYEVGSDGDTDFIAMEYVEGRPLSELIAEGGITVEQAMQYALQIVSALASAHRAGIVHGDLKPGNVILTSGGKVKLLDFGVARRIGSAESGLDVADTGEIAGTLGYMSPEQLRGRPADQRSDLFSFGVLFYEMLAGERPLAPISTQGISAVRLIGGTRDAKVNRVPSKLRPVVAKLLEREAAARYSNADEVAEALSACQLSLTPSPAMRLSPGAWTAVIAAGLVFTVFAAWLWHRSSQRTWAMETAAPEIARLLDVDEFGEAARLARTARAILPNDPTLEKLWMRATGEISVESEPAGAQLSIRPYRGDPNSWTSIGVTPVKKIRIPRELYLWRLQKPGFAPSFFLNQTTGTPPPGAHFPNALSLKLRIQTSVPPGMVVAPGGAVNISYPLSYARPARVARFVIDQFEITNEEYSRFVRAGGYRKPEFWKQPFIRDGHTLSWREAMSIFHDKTGEPGPSTWEHGQFLDGRQKYPVAGVCWYEALAYAAFADKSLPTAYQWTRAAQLPFTPLITLGSNFDARGTQPVGNNGALSGFGTFDMAGNVKEWVWNETNDGKRLILGGGFGEASYMFNYTDAQSPWDRRANFGFRCVKPDQPPSVAEMARIEVNVRDYSKEKPVKDDVFKAYKGLYAYDKGELAPQVENRAALPGWYRERVSVNAAYGSERVPIYLFVPKTAPPPFQVVVYFPGGFAYSDEQLDLSGIEENYGFILNSGRALVAPIYKGTYERHDGLPGDLHPPAFYRDHAIAWSKDFGRTLDYLETRKDMDVTRVAFLGLSAGAAQALVPPTVETRVKAVIASSGGLQLTVKYLPEADPLNFLPHLTVPLLMINGRYDYAFPLETSQRPQFNLVGTPARDKKHIVFEGGHGVFPRPDAVRECLAWLDKYLGPVVGK